MATILIFDDNASLALQWRKGLETRDHYVCCCETLKNALAVANAIKPDIVVVDMMIRKDGKFVPEGGLTLLTCLNLKYSGSPKIIGVSGFKPGPYNKSTPLELAKRIGVDIALYKPISLELLLEAVEQLLTNRQ
ncbi:MAG: response regulator [Leptolyngbyaceae cyanobacterium]